MFAIYHGVSRRSAVSATLNLPSVSPRMEVKMFVVMAVVVTVAVVVAVVRHVTAR
jgi:F0F1-type ATP synthase membrane subunit c/vacuolar-type H+-ATPase subunit K